MKDLQSTLDSIDDAVESRCACGCGVKLRPDGDSMWFASQDCQWKFQQQHADNPNDVYHRPDATAHIYADLAAEERALRQAYLNAPPSAHAPRRGGAFRDAFGQPGDRVRYQMLTPDEREAVHAWVELHGVDHTTVPIDVRFELDEETNEWLIPVYAQRDGRPYLGEDGEVVTEVLRRPNRADLPWPRIQPEPERVGTYDDPVYEFPNGVRANASELSGFLDGSVGGLTPNRVWLGDVEITPFIRSVDPLIEATTAYGPTNWREYINGLRSASMSLTGLFEWSPDAENDWTANRTLRLEPEQVERGVIGDAEHGHWLTERLRRPDGALRRLSDGPFRSLLPDGRRAEDYWTYEPSTVEDWIAANPTVGGRVEPGAVTDFAESLGLELEPWQRQMLNAVYTEPQPRLFGGRGVLTSETLNAAEDRVRQSYGGAVGNILGVPIISSPFVPEGEMYLVNQQPPRFRFEPEPMRWDSNMLRWRMYAHMMPPPQCGDLLVFGNHHHIHYCHKHMPNRRVRVRGAGYTPPRNNPRLKALHVHYRQRVLARRRRRRNR